MIVAVCLNPALDVTYETAHFQPGDTNRVLRVHRRAGGKGVNVARVLSVLREDVLLLGMTGGAVGAAVAADLRGSAVAARLTPIAGETRSTVTVVSDGVATVLSEPGPRTTAAELARFRATYDEVVGDADVVVLSGTLPPDAPTDTYADLVRAAHRAGTRVVVDAGGAPLAAALTARPDVVKPNAAEAAEVLGVPVVSGSEAVSAAAHLVDLGAECAVVTLGERGLVTVRDGYACRARIGSPVTGNATGAGDAVAASLARSLLAGTPWETALAEAVAIATGAVVMPRAGEIDLTTAARMRSRIVVTTELLPNFPAPRGDEA